MDELNSAIVKMRIKSQPQVETDKPFISEPHKGLFPLLDIWGEEGQDSEVNERVKFIHEFLTDEQGTARDKIMHILNELPAISNDKTIDRIWKFCRLKNEYRNTITRAEKLNQRIRAV